MNYYLHAYSSLPVLYEQESLPQREKRRLIGNCAASLELDSKDDVMLRRAGVRARPIHVFVDRAEKRRRAPEVKTHVLGAVPPIGSFIRLSERVYLSSPEFCFLQMASVLDFIELIRFGYELCATYRLDEHLDAGFRQFVPLTDTRKLSAYLSRAGHMKGVKAATRALSYILESARSPRETALAMLLTLHTRYGGWQLPKPVLNHRVYVGGDVEGYLHRYIDLYWPQWRIGLEYDSDAFHVGAERITRDSVREKVLRSNGIRMLRVTNEELLNPIKLDLAISTLERELGRQPRKKKPETNIKRRQLANKLLAPHDNLFELPAAA